MATHKSNPKAPTRGEHGRFYEWFNQKTVETPRGQGEHSKQGLEPVCGVAEAVSGPGAPQAHKRDSEWRLANKDVLAWKLLGPIRDTFNLRKQPFLSHVAPTWTTMLITTGMGGLGRHTQERRKKKKYNLKKKLLKVSASFVGMVSQL